jgi:hypothetical protein
VADRAASGRLVPEAWSDVTISAIGQNLAAAAETARPIEDSGDSAYPVEWDLTSRIDRLVNSARMFGEKTLEVTGIPAPVIIDGIAQKPIEGVSLAYTFDKANADAPSPHHIQYFEVMGVPGLYNDGWMLSAVPVRPPWDLLGTAILDPASAYKFELYDVRHDWTQYTDVAAANPGKMREMTDLMFAEFAKYQVLPLDASVATRMVTPRPSMSGGRRLFTYTGVPVTGIPRGTAPSVLNTSYTITADIDVPQGGGDGMILTDGGRFGGYGMYLLKASRSSCGTCST